MRAVFLADSFSANENALFGRAVANRRLLSAILACEDIKTVYTTVPGSAFSELPLPESSLNKITPLTSLINVNEILTGHQVDAIFCSDFISCYAEWIHYRNAQGLNIPVFGFTHSLSYQRYTADIYRILCARPTLRDGILCTSTCAIEVLQRLFAQVQSTLSIETSPPELIKFPLPLHTDNINNKGANKLSPFQVLCVGRLDWQTKADLLTLTSIIPKLSQELNIRFVMAGPPDNEAYLMLLQRDLEPLGVTLRFSVSDEERNRLYAESHIFFSPSDNYQETFGLTVIEAMRHGCVPIVTDFDGYRDLVPDDAGFRLKTVAARIPQKLFTSQGVVSEGTYHGWWAAGVSYDPLEAVQRIESLARDRSLWEQMSSSAREVAAHYSQKRTVENIVSLLNREIPVNEESAIGTHNPFIWDFTELFCTHPTELWKDQSVALTEEGNCYLSASHDLPQFILLSRSIAIPDMRKFLFLVRRGYTIGECMEKGVEPVILSVALKNGLITIFPRPVKTPSS